MLTLLLLLVLQHPGDSAPAKIAVPVHVLKWDYPAASLAEVQRLQWAAVVDGVRTVLTGVVCAAPTGKTPPEQFSCTVPLKAEWFGKEVAIVAVPPPPPVVPAPLALRLFPLALTER